MRYYAIVIDGAPSVFQSIPGADIAGAQWATLINGQNDPGAQQIEFQIERVMKGYGTRILIKQQQYRSRCYH